MLKYLMMDTLYKFIYIFLKDCPTERLFSKNKNIKTFSFLLFTV